MKQWLHRVKGQVPSVHILLMNSHLTEGNLGFGVKKVSLKVVQA